MNKDEQQHEPTKTASDKAIHVDALVMPNFPICQDGLNEIQIAYEDFLSRITEQQKQKLILALLMKRSVDGLNKRPWWASEHFKFEQFIESFVDA